MATSIRSIDQQYALYQAFKESRAAARENLAAQISDARQGRTILLNVLQAISSLGNSIASEAQALTLYNIELANLEFQTGTILETHGIRFVEEQYTSMSAWGRHFEDDCYPKSLSPQKDGVRYEDSNEEAEKVFNLEDFPTRRSGEEPEKPELPQTPNIDPLAPYEQEQSAKEKKGRMFRWISLERVFRN